MTLERRTRALLDVVEAERSRQCDAIVGGARTGAAALLRQAHAEARSQMRQAFDEERERSSVRVAAARAELQTRRRLAEQQRAATLLAIGLERLADELLRRWRDSSARGAWVSSLAKGALAMLPRTSWRVVHGSDWPAAEQADFSSVVAGELGARPQFITDEGIRAGLRIAADGNLIDGTFDGLLADRTEVGARLLYAIEAAT